MPLPRQQPRVRRVALLAALVAALLGFCREAMAQSQPPSATINGPGQKIVRSVAKAYLDGQPSHHYSRITVTGHTDASHAGNFNIPLSLQRAGVRGVGMTRHRNARIVM
jgi:hypothetical protein